MVDLTLHEDAAVRGEQGDTLIEVLLTVVIVAIAFAALMGALVSAISGSTEHRSLSVDDTLLKSVAESAKNQIETGPGAQFTTCASQSPNHYTINYTMPTASAQFNPSNYKIVGYTAPVAPATTGTVTLSPQPWNGSTGWNAAGSGCASIQLITVSVIGPDSGTQQLSFVVRQANP